MYEDDAEDGIDFLKRGSILAAIEEDGLGRRGLQQRIDVSRTTVYRATEYLEERGLIEATDGAFRLTPRGQGVTAAIDRYRDSLAAADHLAPLLEYVDHPTLLRSLHLFEECEVLTADPGEPYWLTEWLTSQLAAVDYFRGLDLLMGTETQHEVAVERVEAGADFESVIGRDRLSEWGDRTAGRLAEAKRRLGECNAFVGENPPFPLHIYDETVVVVGVDDDVGVPAVCAVTDRAEVRDWAQALYRRYQREAVPVDVDELPA